MKTNLFKQFKTDTESESEGIWFAVEPGVRFLIRRHGGANTHRVKAASAKHQLPLLRKIQAGVVTDKEQYEMALKTFVESCLVGWEGITDEKGDEVPFNVDNAIAVLSPLEDLADALLKYSANFQNYREDLGKLLAQYIKWAVAWQGKEKQYQQVLEKNLLKEKDQAPNISGFEFYLDAFNELGTCRPSAFQGLSPIPFTAIVEYSKIYDIEDFHDFHYYIRVMDNELLNCEHSKTSSKPKTGKRK